jgi:hypothetical protein
LLLDLYLDYLYLTMYESFGKIQWLYALNIIFSLHINHQILIVNTKNIIFYLTGNPQISSKPDGGKVFFSAPDPINMGHRWGIITCPISISMAL